MVTSLFAVKAEEGGITQGPAAFIVGAGARA